MSLELLTAYAVDPQAAIELLDTAERLPCFVNHALDGRLYLLRYDLPDLDGLAGYPYLHRREPEGFTIWIGAVEISCGHQEIEGLESANSLQIELGDGRVGTADILNGVARKTYTAHDGNNPRASAFLWIVGTTPLALPPAVLSSL
jgi:hypothetical protein